MAKLNLFEYWVLKHPTEEQEKEGKITELLIAPTHILASDVKTVNMKVARLLPENEMDNLDNIQIGVRPF